MSPNVLPTTEYLSIFAPCFIFISICCSHCVPQDGWTALMSASSSGHSEVVCLLLCSGAQVDLQDEVRYGIRHTHVAFTRNE